MNRDQLSTFIPENLFASCASEQPSPSDNEAIFVQPITPVANSSARQQVLERLIEQITEQDLLGKSYVEQYLRHKYRRNCKANTLKQPAISLVQFLSFFATRGNFVLEQLNREEIEAFVKSLHNWGQLGTGTL